MKTYLLFILFFIIFSCLSTNDINKKMYGNNWMNEIDYSHPEQYTKNGEQSTLNSENEQIIKENISINKLDYMGIAKAMMFKDRYFSSYAAGGIYVGKLTINDLFQKKELSGCHDHALVIAGILRLFGYPVIMVDCADIIGAKNYNINPKTSLGGHVVLEVFINHKWILLDPTSGDFSTVYDHYSPVIKTISGNNKGELYVLFKGIDTNGYGIYDICELKDNLIQFAFSINKINLHGTLYNYTSSINYYFTNTDSLEKKYKINLTINYKYTGKREIDSNNKIMIQLDRFENGYPITNQKSNQKEGKVIFTDIAYEFENVYLIGWVISNSIGHVSKGDPTLRQLDSKNKPLPIDISKGPVEINVEFDDSIIW